MRIPRQIPMELGALGTAPEALLPVVLTLDDSDSPRDVIDALALTAYVTVTAATAELAAEIMSSATEGMTEEPPPVDEAVSMGFWYASAHGPERNPRPITASSWADIRDNYAGTAAERFDRLVAVDRDSVHGRLLLLHGPPGVGDPDRPPPIKEKGTWFGDPTVCVCP